jgi:hypothetical protein
MLVVVQYSMCMIVYLCSVCSAASLASVPCSSHAVLIYAGVEVLLKERSAHACRTEEEQCGTVRNVHEQK